MTSLDTKTSKRKRTEKAEASYIVESASSSGFSEIELGIDKCCCYIYKLLHNYKNRIHKIKGILRNTAGYDTNIHFPLFTMSESQNPQEIDSQNVYHLTTSGEVQQEEVKQWADGKLLGTEIRDARLGYRALAMVQMPWLGSLSDQDRQNIGMVTLECQSLLEQGELDRALSLEGMLEAYCRKAKSGYSRIDDRYFTQCGDVLLEREQFENALRAYTYKGGGLWVKDALKKVASALYAKIDAALEEKEIDSQKIAELFRLVRETHEAHVAALWKSIGLAYENRNAINVDD